MATLDVPITDGFAPAQAVGANFQRVRVRAADGTPAFRTDVEVSFVVLEADGKTVLEEWPVVVENVGNNFDWFTPAFRSAAWTAYVASKKATVTP